MCNISNSTRIEAEEALRQIIAGEEHALEVASKLRELNDYENTKNFLDFADTLRGLRQELALEGLPFRANISVRTSSIDTLTKIISDIDKGISWIDNFASEMKQELGCSRCREDLNLEEVQQYIDTLYQTDEEPQVNDNNQIIVVENTKNFNNSRNNDIYSENILGDNKMADYVKSVLSPVATALKVTPDYIFELVKTEGVGGAIDFLTNLLFTRFGAKLAKIGLAGALTAYGAIGTKFDDVRDMAYKIATHLLVVSLTPRGSYDFSADLYEGFNLGRLLGFGDVKGVQNSILKDPKQVQAELKAMADETVNKVKEVLGNFSLPNWSLAPVVEEPVKEAPVTEQPAPVTTNEFAGIY